jgi:hypothetical protein
MDILGAKNGSNEYISFEDIRNNTASKYLVDLMKLPFNHKDLSFEV